MTSTTALPPVRERLRRDWPYLVAAGLATAIVLIVLWLAGRTLLLLGAGILVATALHGASSALARLTGLGRTWCLALVCLVLLAAAVAAALLALPEIAPQVTALLDRMRQAWGEFSRRVDDFALGRQALRELEDQAAGQGASGLGQAVQQVVGFASATVASMAELGIVLVLGLYLAIDPELYLRGMLRLLPPARRGRARAILLEIGRTLHEWLVGQLIAMTMVGAVTGLGLWLVGVPQAALLGLLTGLLDFIPNVGPILAAVPGLIAAASVSSSHVLYALIVYALAQAAENNLIVPLVQRRAVDLPPAVTMVALVVMGLLGGVLGLLLAVPLAAALTVAVRMAYVEDVLGDREG